MNHLPPQDRASAATSDRPSRASTVSDPFHETQAIVVLDEAGTIQHISRVARRLLDLGSGTLTGRSFFERVHPSNLNRVKWDLVQMIARGKPEVTWLLRLKTGLGPWQWFKMEAKNRLGYDDTGGIVLWMHERCGRAGRGIQPVWTAR
jgi:PAS domain-containing protein